MTLEVRFVSEYPEIVLPFAELCINKLSFLHLRGKERAQPRMQTPDCAFLGGLYRESSF